VAVEPSGARPFWYLQGGDAVRAIACLGIVCFHVATGALFVTGDLAGSGGTLTWMTAYGEGGRIALRTASTGFYLFFALSGFLVAAPFVAAFIEGRPRPPLVPYFRNRALRLVPAAWLLFAFVLIRYGTRGSDWRELLWMFTFTDDHVDHPLSTLIGQTWTLRVDLTFYVLAPIAATLAIRLLGPRLGVRGRRYAVWAGAAAIAAGALVLAGMLSPTVGSGRSPAVLICLFMPGVALAAAVAGRAPRTPPNRLAAIAAVISLAGVLVLVAYPRDPLPLSARLFVVGAGAGMALGGLVLLETQAGRAWAWMRSGPVRWVGRHTYGIYLWHLVLMAELSALFQGAESPARTYALLLPLVLVATIVVAMISFRLVEKPAMRLRHRTSRPAGTPEHAPPAAPVPAASTA
jgi:peptidoglycan/LPS O-acetylase OafA/YrhL